MATTRQTSTNQGSNIHIPASEPATMTLFVDQLTVMDFSYIDERRGLVGDSWIVDVSLDGELNDQGMIFDFGHVKKQLKAEIDRLVDHKLIIPLEMPALKISHKNIATREVIEVSWLDHLDQECRHSSPDSAVTLLKVQTINPEEIRIYLEQRLRRLLPKNATNLSLDIYPEPGLHEDNQATPYYHYSHGLRKHQGDCQRIAHGHRSKIEIYENGIRAIELEKQWCRRWQDIYIGTSIDLAQPNKNDLAVPENMYRFEYNAGQGPFMIQLPQEACYLIDTESTVEQIAIHIAVTIKQQHPNSTFLVKAYEGVKKGAIARR